MWLTLLSGERQGDSLEVTGEQFRIGRSGDNELAIHEGQLSRSHAVLRPQPDGGVVLEDLGSKNGTFVNGRRIDAPVTLAGGEKLRLGETELEVTREQPGEEDPDATVIGQQPPAGAGAPQAAPPPAQAAPEPPKAGAQEQTPSMIHRIKVEKGVRRNAIIGSAALALAVVFGVLTVLGVFSGGGGDDKTVDDVVAAVEPSTVLIGARSGDKIEAAGTGWVLDADEGLIVTNNHVVGAFGSMPITVGVGEDPRRTEFVATAPCEDVAVLRVSDTDGLETLPLISSQSDLKRGQTVVALGYPDNASLAAELTATQGVVSVASSAYNDTGIDTPRLKDAVQTDAAINPGNSGGPLVDLDEELVGMNFASRTQNRGGDRLIQGQGYAIGVDRLKQVLPELRRGESTGWTGFRTFEPVRGKGLVLSDPAPDTKALEEFGADGALAVLSINGKRQDGSLETYCSAVAGESGTVPAVFATRGGRPVEASLPLE